MNIKFSYLYRDGANYKQYNELIYANPSNIPFEEIEMTIMKHLTDSTWFVADDWHIPNMFFEDYIWNNEVDHNWHEFISVKETNDETTEIETIDSFLLLVRNTNPQC